MKYGFMARVMPLILDKTVYGSIKSEGIAITKELKRSFRKEYRAVIERTPGLAKDNELLSTLVIGCYLISFHKAAPEIVTEKVFEKMIISLCDEMKRTNKENDSIFSEKTIRMKKNAALRSQDSEYEMDWVSTFRQNSKDNYEFTYTKCGLCELGKRENCLYLIKYLCMTDYISYDLGGARLVREHTIAGGDGYCDFNVFRKDR